MIAWFKTRQRLKPYRLLVKEAQHIRNLREDVASADDLQRLDEARERLDTAIQTKNVPELDKAGDALGTALHRVHPPKRWAVIRENIEILAVAMAVAMAFRTYFIQPFKIPTSSMFPSLYGIHYEKQTEPTWSDRFPLSAVKWLLFGEWYVEVRSQAFGPVRYVQLPEGHFLTVNGVPHQIYEDMTVRVKPGDSVIKGQLLASGLRIAGDHIFVDKISWNFRQPHRGEIMVFKTDNIRHSQIKTNEHYVKRMVGLPNEILGIDPPDLLINGAPMREPATIARVEQAQDHYAGYVRTGEYLLGWTNRVTLGPDEFFACGDNQRNSLDSRYWGTVPRKNLVGPTVFVYWPFSARWGVAH